MKVQLKCDDCPKTGTPKEIFTNLDNRDLCANCMRLENLAILKQQHAELKAWLESTHLKRLRDIEQQISNLESKVEPCRT